MKNKKKSFSKALVILVTNILLFATLEPGIIFAIESESSSSMIELSEIKNNTKESSEVDSSTTETEGSEAIIAADPVEPKTDIAESIESKPITVESSEPKTDLKESNDSETILDESSEIKIDTEMPSKQEISATSELNESEKEIENSSVSKSSTVVSADSSDEEIFSLDENREDATELMEKENNKNIRMFARVMTVPATTTFINKIAPYAVEAANKYGLFPSVMIAQASLESGWGTSSLASSPNNNLFGVKGSYDGKYISMPTKEWSEEKEWYTIYQNFRKYPSFLESLTDYAQKLKNGLTYQPDNYSGTWRANADGYKEAAAGLIKPVAKYSYATDPTYAKN